MRRAAKRDVNEASIIEALRAAGCDVIQCDEIDLIAGRAGKSYLLECKQPGRRNKLRPIQEKLLANWRGHYAIVTTPQEALAAVGLRDER